MHGKKRKIIYAPESLYDCIMKEMKNNNFATQVEASENIVRKLERMLIKKRKK